jgi:DNA-binding GntR family transcriptional regulator
MISKNLKQIAYASIKENILNCEYMPNSFLSEDLLCEQFQVSRTPIRDALSRLEQEHLITILPKKGILVAPLSTSEINMVFEGRLLLEPYIILNYCKNMPPKSIDFLFNNMQEYRKNIQAKSNQMFKLDDEYHQCIVSQCTNRYLTQVYKEICDQNYRIRILSGLADSDRLLYTVEEHQTILNHLVQGQLEEAAQAMKSHLINSKKASFLSYIESNSTL